MLNIIGRDDGEEKSLLNLRKKLNLEKNVHFLGFQSNPYRFFYFSDLFVLSSRREGLPNAVLENLYLKKPIVATQCIPYLSTLINHGKNGYIVPTENPKSLASAILNFENLTEQGFRKKHQPTNPNIYFKK